MLRKGLLLLFAILLVAGCGGGGGSSAEPASSGPGALKVVDVSPADGAADVAVNGVISVTFNEDLDPASVDSADFSVVQGGSIAGTVSVSGKKVSFTPEKDWTAKSTCVVVLSGVKGKSGSTMDKPLVFSFMTGDLPDTKPPSVKVVTPENGAIVSKDAEISAIFDEPLDPYSGKAWLYDGAVALPTTMSVSGDKVTITADRLASKFYKVILEDFKDLAGNAIAVPVVWVFTTDNAPDTTPPSIVYVSPSSGAVVAVDTIVSAMFNEAIDPTSVTPETFRLIDNAGAVVAGSLTVKDTVEVEFTPSANLAYGSHYEVKIKGVKDLAGNSFSLAPSVWNFTTVAAPVVINLATSDWVTYSAGGAAQATFDKTAGTVTVNVVGAYATDVSVRWAPLVIDKSLTYHVSFPCTSVPQQNVEVQLKQNGGAYHAYSTTTVACTGTVEILMAPDGDDPAGRLNINFGAATGAYTIGTVTVRYE